MGLHSISRLHYDTSIVIGSSNSSFQDLLASWQTYFMFADAEDSEHELIPEPVPESEPSDPLPRRANAALIMLARNSEIESVAYSMKQLEDRFNKQYNYPWVFLNDEPFTEEFINRTKILTNGNASYGLIPREHWVQPDWIDEAKASSNRWHLIIENVLYGGSVSYRNMCRFNSGFFYRHELLQPYRYYWRVEPDVRFYCDIDYDPFLKMQEEGKVYGFTMALKEFEKTIPTLWSTVKSFIARNPESIHPDNALGFLSEDFGQSYNLCHFWSNFEIADMEFWRNETYSKFFDYLDNSGGFYYERWGDAPVHSIAASLFLPKDKLHFFTDIGYKHSIFQHCPQGKEHTRGKCWCDPQDNFDHTDYSCIPHFEKLFPIPVLPVETLTMEPIEEEKE